MVFFFFILSATSSTALEIEVLDMGPIEDVDPTIFPLNDQERAAVDRAEQIWEEAFSDDITVAITLQLRVVTSEQLPPGTVQIVGQANSRHVTFVTEIVKEALLTDALFSQDQDIYQQLSDVIIPNRAPEGHYGESCRLTLEPHRQPALYYTRLTSANARAIGLVAGPDADNSDNLPFPNFDAHINLTIRMADGLNRDQVDLFYDYDQADGVPNFKTDFVAVVAHEIGHALGFGSAVENMHIQRASCLEELASPSLLDLFRFRPETTQDLHNPFRQLHFGPAEFFAADSDIRPEFGRGNGALTLIPAEPDPDCEQFTPAPHWRCTSLENGEQLLMNGTIGRGAVTLKQTDKRAFDLIGYDSPDTVGNAEDLPDPIDIRAGHFQSNSLGMSAPGQKFPIGERPVFPKSLNQNSISGILSIDWKFDGELKFEGRFVYETERPNPKFVSAHRKVNKAPHTQMTHRAGAACFTGTDEVTAKKVLPARITEFSMRSTNESGPHINLTAALPVYGVIYDPGLGEFGGFAITFLVDIQNKEDEADIDGLVTLNLEADRQIDASSILNQVTWKISSGKAGNRIRIKDFAAFGLRPPTRKH